MSWGGQWAGYNQHDNSAPGYNRASSAYNNSPSGYNNHTSSGYNNASSGYNNARYNESNYASASQGRYSAPSGGASYHAGSGNQYPSGQGPGPVPRGSSAAMSSASASWRGPQLGPKTTQHASYQSGYQGYDKQAYENQAASYPSSRPAGPSARPTGSIAAADAGTSAPPTGPSARPTGSYPAANRPAGAPAKPSDDTDVTLEVSSCGDLAVSQIIMGKYTKIGENHNRPMFKKTDKAVGAPDGVLLYFWDTRDGPQNSGWWFGPKVGGEQVWSHNQNASSRLPPSVGWKVPFNGPVDAQLKVKTIEKRPPAEDNDAQPNAKQARTDSYNHNSKSAASSGTLEEINNKPLEEFSTWQPGETENPEIVVRKYMAYLKNANLNNYLEIATGLEKYIGSQRGGVMSWRKIGNDCLEATRRRLGPAATQLINQTLAKLKFATPDNFESCRQDLLDKVKKIKGIVLPPSAPGPEAIEKAIDSAQKRIELLAALPVRKALQKLQTNPEDIAAIQTELLQLIEQQREKMGSIAGKIQSDVENALVAAQAKLVQQEKAKAAQEEFEREQAEEAKKLTEAIAEIRAEATKAVDDSTKAVETNMSSEDPEEEVQLSGSVEEAIVAARALVDDSLNKIKDKYTEVSEKLKGLLVSINEKGLNAAVGASAREQLTKAQSDLNSIRDELLASGRALKKGEEAAMEVKEKATRKVVAAKREKEQQELFTKYCAEGSEILARADVIEFAKVEYELTDLSEEFIGKIDGIVGEEGLPYARFARLRQALAIERSEVRAREKKRQEEEARRKAHEENERRKKELAERKLKAQHALDEAVDSQEDAESSMPKAEKAAAPLLNDERLSAQALVEAASATETALEPVVKALDETKARLEQAEKLLGADLKHLLEKDLAKAQARREKCCQRVERLQVEAKAAQERSAKKVQEEQKAKKRQKDVKKLQAMYDDYD